MPSKGQKTVTSSFPWKIGRNSFSPFYKSSWGSHVRPLQTAENPPEWNREQLQSHSEDWCSLTHTFQKQNPGRCQIITCTVKREHLYTGWSLISMGVPLLEPLQIPKICGYSNLPIWTTPIGWRAQRVFQDLQRQLCTCNCLQFL